MDGIFWEISNLFDGIGSYFDKTGSLSGGMGTFPDKQMIMPTFLITQPRYQPFNFEKVSLSRSMNAFSLVGFLPVNCS